MIVAGRFKIEEKLGSGSYADVYCAMDMKTNEKVAVKLDHSTNDPARINSESMFLELLENSQYFPKLIWHGKYNSSKAMVTNLLGPSIFAEYLKRNRFTNIEIASIGTQMVSALEIIHGQGIIHKDIKPDNILIDPIVGIEKVYLIDFGIAKRYADPISKQQVPFRDDNEFNGNLMFASKNVVMGCTPSRRDDLESLAYTLIFLLTGTLPWSKKRKASESLRRQRQLGLFTSDFARIPEELTNIVNYSQKLKYHERPNYQYIISLLKEISKREDFYVRTPNRRPDVIPLETEFRSKIISKRSRSMNQKESFMGNQVIRGVSNIDIDNNPTLDGTSPSISQETRKRIIGLRRDSRENLSWKYVFTQC
ncbi:unnamed protein product [Blepharisma stoltei]|uniref:Casein kinase I n=1 Tax=Blepharisma stoltei TaxID=1481888 RepID=A0AAU9KAT5_9CILI|nr:unnamed protein product [Blepharisma stoltei]